jgi:hypothetical protein
MSVRLALAKTDRIGIPTRAALIVGEPKASNSTSLLTRAFEETALCISMNRGSIPSWRK